ncbi:hypothetical protein ABN034_23155 [Actinopolymorpha sp. B11F2]|uniref:hypothetical protein n=1 Tax=Actinopolymorpha sp. B11F2 TaxID=3160862 RepID=UPI0032E46EAF
MSETTLDHGELLELADDAENDGATDLAAQLRYLAGERLEDLADRGGCLDCGQTMTELASGDVVCTPCGNTWDDWDDYLRDVERQAA